MKFTFRFESLLAYRNHRKELAETALGRARLRLRRDREIKAQLERRHREAGDELRGLLNENGSVELLRSYADFLVVLERKAEEQDLVITRDEKEVGERLKEVLARTTESRIMENLKEKDHKAWLYDQRRKEQKALDEIAVIRHGRSLA